MASKTSLRWKIAQAAEIRWWQRYLNKQPKAEYLAWKREYWTTFLKKLNLTIRPTDKVLDVGCGPAGVYMVLPSEKIDALDPLLMDYEEKLAHFSKSQYPQVQFFGQPFEDFKIEKPYDTVFCLNAINHVSDLEGCFDKLVQTIKPGGDLIVSIDAHNFQAFKHIFRLLPGDILHPHQYDLAEYQKMLTDRGCEIKQVVLYKKEFFFDYYVLHVVK